MPLLDPAPHLPNDLPRPRFPPTPLRPTVRNEASSSSGRETRRADEPNGQRAPDEAEADDAGRSVPLGFDRDHRAEPSEAFRLDDVSELVAARRSLALLRSPRNACRDRPEDERLAAYASGRCDRGLEASRARARLGWALFAGHRPPEPARDAP